MAITTNDRISIRFMSENLHKRLRDVTQRTLHINAAIGRTMALSTTGVKEGESVQSLERPPGGRWDRR
jgi:hypothetical protein